MADFVSGFWSWFIIIPTVGGLAGVAWITWRNTERRDPGAAPDTMGHVWDEDLEEYNNPLPAWWIHLFYITIAIGAVYLLLYPGLGAFSGLLGWSQRGQYEQEVAAADARFGPLFEKYSAQPIVALARDGEARETGARLFATYCAACHGSDARGATGFPDLTDGDWLYGGAPETIEATILEGRNGAMPAWLPIAGEGGVAELTAYVLRLAGRPADATLAAAGAEKFKTFCIGCHMADGRGNPGIGAPNLTDGIWLYGGHERSIARSIAGGREGRMPPHRAFLGEAKVHLLAAYVYSLSSR